MEVDGVQVTVVDTPGLRADRSHDSALKAKINKLYVYSKMILLLLSSFSCQEQERWPAFIYCHNIQNPRYDRTRSDCFEVVQELFTQPDHENICSQPVAVAIVTTHWDNEGTRSYAGQMNRNLEFRDKVWAKWLRRGRCLHRSKDTTIAARDIVHSLFQSEKMVRRVREEIYQECRTNFCSYADSVRYLEKMVEPRLKGFEFLDQRLELEAKLRILKSCEVPSKRLWPISSTTLTRLARNIGGQK
jgi:hypothetical protein